jgi:hypothetical protein
VFIHLYTFAQNTLTVTVLDDEGQTLYGATVIIKDSNNGAVTDTQGQFTLSSLRSFPRLERTVNRRLVVNLN